MWDCVATCFLLDATAHVLHTIRHIHYLLKPNGLWTNVGPLLYHHADREMGWSPNYSRDKRQNRSFPRVPIVELTLEELKTALPGLGFKVIKGEYVRTSYNRDPHSLMHTVYECPAFSCLKTEPVPLPPRTRNKPPNANLVQTHSDKSSESTTE